ncbi:MAG: gamma-glutamyl-gamma-aminobutyrate hydrolase family protein [Acidimicrobiia bacterium]
MARPLIAITGRLSPTAGNVRGEAFASGQRYSRAVVRAGAQPATLPPITEDVTLLAESLARFDGLVLQGGGDVDPRRYGEEPGTDALYGVIPEHDDLEFTVLAAARSIGMPILAICRGMQVLNVACGGTLVQDIGSEDHWLQLHPVTLDDGSRLAEAFGTRRPLECHSVHHQSLRLLGDGLRVVGHADDGTVEAVELEGDAWIVGVQWHPEDTAADDAVQQRVFDTFVREVVVHRRR